MKKALTIWAGILCFSSGLAQTFSPYKDYVQAWKQFYPSKAVAMGFHDAILAFEDRSAAAVQAWIGVNKTLAAELKSDTVNALAHQINRNLVRLQIQKELTTWEHEEPHKQKLSTYANLITQAISGVEKVKYLDTEEKRHLLHQRLESVKALCTAAKNNIVSTDKDDLQISLKSISSAIVKYRDELTDKYPSIKGAAHRQTINSLEELAQFAKTKLLPESVATETILGAENYARKWADYSDSGITPDSLATLARKEISLTKELMVAVAKRHWAKKYSEQVAPHSDTALLNVALRDMQSDVTSNAKEYTQFWNQLSDSLILFLKEKEIATVPDHQTLSIQPAPESAGPAARIGWVSSAPPFAANPWTTLYLPSIPDTVPEDEKIAFWSSFNKPFNRMIAIHELFPGHYMQIKVSRETPHPIRLMFPYGPYFEGWATFTEKIVLDAGWDADKPLSMLAHLRKRLENANRAYTSVMVHCHGWNREKVMQFSTEVSLLAPQFAKSLWGRLLRGPMQMTSYFYGVQLFHRLYDDVREKQGARFVLKDFMDTLMRQGPIVVDDFESVFAGD